MAEKKYFTGAVIGAIDIEIAYVAQYLTDREGWKRLSESVNRYKISLNDYISELFLHYSS